MSEDTFSADDPRSRPQDPAGTRPKHDPADLLPENREPLLPPSPQRPAAGVVDGDAIEEPWSTVGAPRAASHDDTPPVDTSEVHEGERGEVLPARRPADAVAAGGHAAIPARAQARFHFVLGALLALGAAGLVVAVLIALSPEDRGTSGPSGPAWSQWRPDGDAKTRVMEIADRVGRQYRGSGGQQLVAVTGGPLEVAGLPLTVALRESAEQGGDIELKNGDGILYRLCGLGEKCAIANGKPSRERHLLLRREALELALYTFHYVGVDHVVVFMPPPKGSDPDEALFFQRRDLEPQIDRPLAESLVPRTPSVSSVTRSPDSSFVNDLTIETLFNFSLTQGNSDSRAFLVLDPLGTKTK